MKNTRILVIAITACFFVLWGCNKNGGTPNDGNEVAQDTIPPIPSDPVALPKSTFGSLGLDFIALGDTVTWKEITVEGALEIRDTVFVEQVEGEEGMEEIAWNVKRIIFQDGEVTLETDFERGLLLNRVQIDTRMFQHWHTGARVGTTVGELNKMYPELFVRPFPEYGVIEVMPDNHNIFHVEDKDYFNLEDPDSWTIDKLPDDARVMRIVVM